MHSTYGGGGVSARSKNKFVSDAANRISSIGGAFGSSEVAVPSCSGLIEGILVLLVNKILADRLATVFATASSPSECDSTSTDCCRFSVVDSCVFVRT